MYVYIYFIIFFFFPVWTLFVIHHTTNVIFQLPIFLCSRVFTSPHVLFNFLSSPFPLFLTPCFYKRRRRLSRRERKKCMNNMKVKQDMSHDPAYFLVQCVTCPESFVSRTVQLRMITWRLTMIELRMLTELRATSQSVPLFSCWKFYIVTSLFIDLACQSCAPRVKTGCVLFYVWFKMKQAFNKH